jgi:hypothetical protein
MNAYPVLVDLETRQVFLGNLSGGVADKFMHLFAETFGCGLEPADPQRIAVRALGSTRRARSIDNLSPCHFVRPPSGFEGNGADAALPGLRFVGREFLTWLWYQTEAADEALQLNGGTTVTLMLDHTLRMQCDFGLTGTDVITAEGPTRCARASSRPRPGWWWARGTGNFG